MIVVVGSINSDLVFEVDQIPHGGETVTALAHTVVAGGKGANQAVAAARLGADVTFVGCVGSDATGDLLISDLSDEGVDAELMAAAPGATGTAVVAVDRHGENAIIVNEGANGLLQLRADQMASIKSANVVLCQQEIPMSTVLDAASIAEGVVILNAAPAKELPVGLLDHVDILVVNEHEILELSAGTDPSSVRRLGVSTVVTTLGAAGAQIVTESDVGFVEPPDVSVRDTTGAGDTFCGALAAAIDSGCDVFEAAARGVVAGSLATQGIGARTAMPTLGQLEETLGKKRSRRPMRTHEGGQE
jgi:ribokinase